MIPEEKAKDLFVKNIELIPDYIKQIDAKHIAKYCAIIAVDQILDNMMLYQENFDAGKPVHHKSYWQEVKQEIEKL
jgi:predicted transcriptional regulator